MVLLPVLLIFGEYVLMQASWPVSVMYQQHGVSKVQRWERGVEGRQTHRNRSSLMVEMYDELRECKSKLEEADGKMRNMTLFDSGATNLDSGATKLDSGATKLDSGATKLDSDVTNLTVPTNPIPVEELTVLFTETMKGRGCAEGERESIEVQGSNGSRMKWSCDRSGH